jgi:Holliday junction resolvase RusA-like endonuclease
MAFHIIIPGDPVTSTSQQKRAVSLPGRGIRFFKKPAYVKAEESLIFRFRQDAPDEPIHGPIRCVIAFSFPFRKSETKARKALAFIAHDKRPDLDNMAKLYCDCLSKAGIIEDDAQIAELILRKVWTEIPSVEITVSEIDPPNLA